MLGRFGEPTRRLSARIAVRVGSTVACALLLAACAVTETSSPSPNPIVVTSPPSSPTAATTAPPTLGPTGAPTMSPTPVARIPHGLLAAGTYTSGWMTPNLQFAVPDGWDFKDEQHDLLYLTRGQDRIPSEFRVLRVASAGVIDKLLVNGEITSTAPAPFASALGEGLAVDIRVKNGGTLDPFVATPAESDASLYLAVGTTARVIEFNLDGVLLVVVYSAPSAQFAAFASESDAIAASLTVAGR